MNVRGWRVKIKPPAACGVPLVDYWRVPIFLKSCCALLGRLYENALCTRSKSGLYHCVNKINPREQLHANVHWAGNNANAFKGYRVLMVLWRAQRYTNARNTLLSLLHSEAHKPASHLSWSTFIILYQKTEVLEDRRHCILNDNSSWVTTSKEQLNFPRILCDDFLTRIREVLHCPTG